MKIKRSRYIVISRSSGDVIAEFATEKAAFNFFFKMTADAQHSFTVKTV